MIDENLFIELYEHGYVDTTISMRMGIPLSKVLKFRIDQGLPWKKPLATFTSEQELVRTIKKLVKKGMMDIPSHPRLFQEVRDIVVPRPILIE
jgi:hypothetical protein